MNRVDWLKSLLQLDRPLGEIIPALTNFGWDSDETLGTLERKHFVSVLKRYLDNQIGSQDVTDWANALECREDISFDSEHEDLVKEALFELANPYLTRSLSHETASEWINCLK